MKLDYFFRDNLKKQWYNDWKLFQPLYGKLIEKQDIKGIDTLISTRTDEILKNQKNQSEKTISNLMTNIDEIKKNISQIEQEKIDNKKSIIEKYESNTNKNDEDYNFYITSDLEVINNINIKLHSFYENITEYTQNAKENIQNNINKLLDYFLENHNYTYNITEKEANKILNQNIDSYINITSTKRIEGKRDIIMLWFLFIIVIFDAILWYKVIKDTFSGIIKWFRLEFTAWFMAIAMIALIVWLTHYILKELKTTKDKIHKNIYIITLLMLLWILFRYIKLSVPNLSINQMFSTENKNAMETLIRLLLIPALIWWEIIIEKINWNNIFFYWKKLSQPFRYVKWLIAKQIYIINKNKIIQYMEDEKETISQKAEEINSNIEKNIAFSKILETVDSIKSLLWPIYEQHESKINEYEYKKQDIENKKRISLENIESNYNTKKEQYERKINEIENQIRLIKQQLWDAENSIWSGIKIGLTS